MLLERTRSAHACKHIAPQTWWLVNSVTTHTGLDGICKAAAPRSRPGETVQKHSLCLVQRRCSDAGLAEGSPVICARGGSCLDLGQQAGWRCMDGWPQQAQGVQAEPD